MGNVSGWTAGGSVDLDDSRLVSRTWSRAISATDSRIASTVGRCSTLRNPSAHGWAESLGLLSGYRCRSSVASDLLVSTIHAVTLPALPHPEAADRYDTIVVKAYGGAARTRTTSTGTIRYFSAAGASGSVRAMSAPVGYHAGYVRNAPSLVRPDQSFRWGTYTSAGRQYDVKHFVVTLTYSVLE